MTESPELIDQAESLYDKLLPLMQADAPEVYGRKVKAQAAIVEALALRTPSDGEDEAETWCRLAGKAMDALDTLSNWEVESDDEDAAGLMADFAEKATAEIRAAYPARQTALSTLTPGKE